MQKLIILYFVITIFGGIEILPILNYGVTINDIMIFLLIIFFFREVIWKGTEIKIAKNPAIPFYFLLILFVLTSVITPILSGNKIFLTQYFKTTSHFFLYVFLIIISLTIKIENKSWIKIIKYFLLISIFINLFGFYQLFARLYDLPFAFFEFNSFSSQLRGGSSENILEQSTVKLKNFYRATSIFTEPSGLAAFNLVILTFSFFPLLHRKINFLKNKFLIYTIIILNIISILLTYSMTAAGVIFFLFLGYFVLTKFQNLLKLFKYLIFALVVLIIADYLIKDYVEVSVLELFSKRITSLLTTMDSSKYTAAESLPQRLKSAEAAISAWKISPVFGVGLGLLAFYNNMDILFADSSFFLVLSQTGILGALSFIGIFAVSMGILYKLSIKKVFLKRDSLNDTLLISSYYLLIYIIIINFFTANNFVNPYLWSYLAMVFSITSNELIKNGKEYYQFKLVETPLALKFKRSISEYIYMKTNNEGGKR